MKIKSKGRKWRIASCAAGMVLLISALAALYLEGILLPNHPSSAEYPVRGVDVSAYQGEIDWEVLGEQGIRFAFIKATEGSSFVDGCFAQNWSGAQNAGLRAGAYHFFSFESPGATQAENFIGAVEAFDGMLPPVVDVELYGDFKRNPPEPEAVWEQLDALLERLKAHYGREPILYATQTSYRRYLRGRYGECDIWIRDVLRPAKLADGRAWTFWQYADRGRLKGYAGEERFIDLNVFCGTAEDFERYGA